MILDRIELPRAPRVLYLFGLTGVGKTFVGSIIGEVADFHVYEADADLPVAMREKVARGEAWTEDEWTGFYFIIRDRVRELLETHRRVVVTQATYRRDHRELMRSACDDLEFVWITADRAINLDRIRARNDYVTVEYFELSLPYFEEPPDGTKRIVNDTDAAAIVRQLTELFG